MGSTCRRLRIAFVSREQSSSLLLSASRSFGCLRLTHYPDCSFLFNTSLLMSRLLRLFLYIGCLDASGWLNPWIWAAEFLDIKHFSDLHSRTFSPCQICFRMLFSDWRFEELLLFLIVNKWYRLRWSWRYIFVAFW